MELYSDYQTCPFLCRHCNQQTPHLLIYSPNSELKLQRKAASDSTRNTLFGLLISLFSSREIEIVDYPDDEQLYRCDRCGKAEVHKR